MSNAPFSFCPFCASELSHKVINELDRKVCSQCGYVQWRNPVVGVAIILMKDDNILLGKRARGPYKDMWCIPCGYVEYDEDVREAAIREFEEETGVQVKLSRVYTVHSNFHNPTMHSVGIWFLAEIVGGELCANDDLSEVAYFSIEQIPQEMAFETDLRVIAQLREEQR